jgi:hypothetical protein
VVVPAGEPIAPEFEGKALRADLEEIVALARESQRTREMVLKFASMALKIILLCGLIVTNWIR